MSSETRTVVQVGPVTTMPGGIAAVIEQYLRLDLKGWELLERPSYWPGRPVRGLLAAATFPLWSLRRRERRRTIVHAHLSEGGSFVREGFIVRAAARLGHPVAVTLHGAGFADFARRRPALARGVLASASVVFCLGEDHADLVRQLVPRAKPVLILNPVEVGRLEERPVPTGDLVVFGGEIGSRKGVDRLLLAWPIVVARVPHARLVLFGPKTGEIDLPESVEDGGVIDRSALRTVLASATVACLPSRQEVLPMFILEALSEGTPVVATAAGEWRSFAGADDVTWVANDDATVVADLAEALVDALETPKTTSPTTGAWLHEHASTSAVGRTLTAAYDRLVGAER